MSLLEHYQRALTDNGYSPDPAQLKAVTALERVRGELLAREKPRRLGARLRGLLATDRQPATVRGAYLWGGVGRGKTFAMDLFFEALPFDDKLRYHFHRLMYRVHQRLREQQQQRDPLEVVAEELAAQARVICFDEFFVADIGDAMILARLLDALFERGVTLVATSNIPPRKLYSGGLQRQKFLPAIDLIETHTEVMEIDGGIDYRLRVLEQADIFHSPLDAGAEQNLHRYFGEIAPDAGTSGQPIEVLGRDILTRRRADGIVWFEFEQLCGGPRSQNDYIEIARSFQTVLLGKVPVLDKFHENEARRFIALVDEFYDRRVKLIISAAAEIDRLYTGQRLSLEFERTRSRLREMQSHDYLAAAHLP
jgi:cell division protein ZapE